MTAVVCPRCGQRSARRSCPALGQQICASCCGTKRLVEIKCPSDCGYLVSAHHHPPAVALRRQHDDVLSVVNAVRDLNQRQSQVFLAVNSFLIRYQPPEFQSLLDEDVAEAAKALAATLETASRGVIYEHRPDSRTADGIIAGLKPLLAEAGKGAGSAFDSDAAVVLRRIEQLARDRGSRDPANRRGYLDLMARVVHASAPQETGQEQSRTLGTAEPRLIVP
jgi:hypothetical protein